MLVQCCTHNLFNLHDTLNSLASHLSTLFMSGLHCTVHGCQPLNGQSSSRWEWDKTRDICQNSHKNYATEGTTTQHCTSPLCLSCPASSTCSSPLSCFFRCLKSAISLWDWYSLEHQVPSDSVGRGITWLGSEGPHSWITFTRLASSSPKGHISVWKLAGIGSNPSGLANWNQLEDQSNKSWQLGMIWGPLWLLSFFLKSYKPLWSPK